MATTSYDEIPYPAFPYAQSHPDRLATLATMFGMRPQSIERCRVLELGCGHGANLIPMAFDLPNSEFIGIDLSETAIAQGREAVAGLGLTNIRLDAADIMQVGKELGEFDYIIAHGVYSWVPAMVRDRVLAIAHEHLAPQGIAYVSYNAMPGCHVRLMLREMILFHLRNVNDPRQRLDQTLEFLRGLLAAPESEENTAPGLIKDEIKGLLERDPGVLFHDELSEEYFLIAFVDFVAHAASHGLRFVAEANIYDMEEAKYAKETQQQLRQYSGGDRMLREQYMDFLKCRKFRQTLLCHDSIEIPDHPIADRIAGMYLTSSASAVSPNPDLTGNSVEEFKGRLGAGMKTDHPLAKTAMGHLIQVWPATLHFNDLLAICRDLLGDAADPEALKEILSTLYRVGLVDAHVRAPNCVSRAGTHPAAWPLARFHAERGVTIPTLRHTSIEATGEIERRLLTLLDGTRDRAALCAQLAAMMQPQPRPEKLMAELEKNLTKLARFGLLVA